MKPCHACTGRRQRGASLVVSLLMLVAVVLLGISATNIALQGEKSSRNERDRQIAFQAAEAALMDAELDIENSTATNSRSTIFSKDSAEGFPGDGEETCRAGIGNRYLGLCNRGMSSSATPAWLKVDFSDLGDTTVHSVPFGQFTGRAFQTGAGALPERVPRYIIELMTYNRLGENAEIPSYIYRITAIGYGAHDTTYVVLQTFYRKED